MNIFEKSQTSRMVHSLIQPLMDSYEIDPVFIRKEHPCLPELSELEIVRHFTILSQNNFCIDTHFFPLGSCTMKYNPKVLQGFAQLVSFKNTHPLAPLDGIDGIAECLNGLEQYLQIITGMDAVSLTPMAGAQGEWAGCAIIQAYHFARGDKERTEMIVPQGAHGTNPASAHMCGFTIIEVPVTIEGNLDLNALNKLVNKKTAGIMLTNPSTLGVFEQPIQQIAQIIHQAGGLMYYDGANLNAIIGIVKPAAMGFDVMHINTHKTFATPHGGGGPGSGPIAVVEKLRCFLPYPNRESNSIGRLSTFNGNTGVLLRAWGYIALLGEKGLQRISRYAVLNANYLKVKLAAAGYTLAYPQRRATHEFIITLKQEAKDYGISALDVAKRLLNEGFYAPTTYFPTFIPECLLIEPTETESKQTLDRFIEAMIKIRWEIENDPEKLRTAPLIQPSCLPTNRVNEIEAAKKLELVWNGYSTAAER